MFPTMSTPVITQSLEVSHRPVKSIADPELSGENSALSLANLINAVSPVTAPPAPGVEVFAPPVPQQLEEAGLTEALIEELILKTLFVRGEVIGREIAATLGLKFSVIETRVDFLKRQRLIEAKGSLGFGSVSSVFVISEAGRSRAREYLEQNQYIGAAPVPIAQYTGIVRSQRSKSGWLTQDALKEAYKGMIVSPDILAQIGPAVNSGKSFLMYGQPGNGKTYLAEALFRIDSSPIYVPYAIECQGMIIKVFDPVYHHAIEETEAMVSSVSLDAQHDGRWVRCRRPFIITGGELTISMLDLGYNAITKVYDAPFQLKANNGIYLIDDFGRQKASPAEVLNRWIVPMDRRVDYLSFNTGGKMEVPFETFLIFSTNLQPENLGDEAFLRRIQYKMFLRNPARDEFIEIFQSFCASQGLECPSPVLGAFLEKHYDTNRKKFRRCQPRDVISHAIDLINFEKLPFELTGTLLDRAFEGCFVTCGMDD
jgi:predicted ATPase with chaperone activity